jgi:hypothetical protein
MTTVTINTISTSTGTGNPPGALTLGASVAAGDRIILVVATERGGTQSVATISSSPTRTWTKYTSFQNTGTLNNTEVEIWYADNPTLINAATLAVSVTFNSVPDDWYLGVFSATSSNGSVAWDVDGPFTNNSTTSTAVQPTISGVNVAAAVSAVMYFFSGSGGGQFSATGYTSMFSATNFAGADHNSLSVGFQNFTGAQTGLSLANTNTNSGKWVLMVASLVPGGSEVDVPGGTHGLGISMSAALNLNLPPLNAGLGITFTSGQPQNFPLVKIVPAPMLLGLTETYLSPAYLYLPAMTFLLGLSVSRAQATQTQTVSASFALGFTEAVVRFGTTLSLPALNMNLGIQEQAANISGATQRLFRTIVDVST